MLSPQPHEHVNDDELETAVDFDRARAAGERAAWAWLAITDCRDCWSRFNELRWQRARGAPEVGELREYLGDRFEDGRDGTLALAERWRRLGPRSDDEIAAFYSTAGDYLYDLALFHGSGERMDYPRELTAIAREYHCGDALDYGCGIGSDGLALLGAAIDVAFIDYRNPGTDYLRWRLRRRGLDVESLLFVGDPIPEADMVYALDVFEHLTEPEAIAKVLARRARKLLIYNVLFRVDSDTICPMHLADHDPVVVARAVENRLSSLGMRRLNDDPLLTVWAT